VCESLLEIAFSSRLQPFPSFNLSNTTTLGIETSVTMAGNKKINKAKARATVITTYEVLAGMDGNPNTPKEFDESPHTDEELFFKADDDATQVCTLPPSPRRFLFHAVATIGWRVAASNAQRRCHAFTFEQTELMMSLKQADKNKVLILNFIHQELHHGTERKIPALTEKDNTNIETYHRVNYRGVDLDVCVYWPPREDGEFKACFAMVKFASDDLSAEYGENGVVSTDAAWNADAKADKFTLKNDKLMSNYWAPRWKVCCSIAPLDLPLISCICLHL
jgi:hypothetical protein